jgi:iron-sulfur cluster repair protein YtfE (RIC family)
MNAIHLLVAQHRAIETLFDEVTRETRRHMRSRATSRLTEELIAHMAAEEAIFYPAARPALGTRRGASHAPHGGYAGDEHFMLRAQLRRVLATSLHTPAFTPRVEALRTLFVHHVRTEEDEVFPQVEATLPPARLASLASDLEAARPPIWLVTTETHAAMLGKADGSMRGVRLPSLREN